MKFKVGDRVKIVNDDHNEHYEGLTGKVTKVSDRYSKYPYHVKFDDEKTAGRDSDTFRDAEIKKIGKGRPKKEKPVKFIAIYDKTDRDPHETFTSRKELNKWLKESKEDEDIIFGSIKVFEIKKEFEVKTSFSLKAK